MAVGDHRARMHRPGVGHAQSVRAHATNRKLVRLACAVESVDTVGSRAYRSVFARGSRGPKPEEPRVTLVVNGEPQEVEDGITISALLARLSLASERVAVEVNTEVVRRPRHPEHRLAEGDQVEIVTFVGGG